VEGNSSRGVVSEEFERVSDVSYNSEDDSDFGSESESEMETQTGALQSKHSIVRLEEENKEYLSVNLFIQMEYCADGNLQDFIEKRNEPDRL
jgi:hypothetical protein